LRTIFINGVLLTSIYHSWSIPLLYMFNTNSGMGGSLND
jgi:hypothetical protein